MRASDRAIVSCDPAVAGNPALEQAWRRLEAEALLPTQSHTFHAALAATFLAGTPVALFLAGGAGVEAEALLPLCHAPGLPALASLLADGEGSDPAHDALAHGYPTCGIAVLRFSGHWRDLDFGGAVLDRFHVARASQPA